MWGSTHMVHGVVASPEDIEMKGRIRIHGEVWWARSAVSLQAGERVKVVGMDGLVLTVVPLQEEN